MKALSLWQPWASYVAHGVKKIETRSWGTEYRGYLAIHSAKIWKQDQRLIHRSIYEKLPDNCRRYFLGDPPRGFVLCVVKLLDCYEMTHEIVENCKENHPLEYAVGDWQVGRFAWLLEHVETLKKGIKVRGHQRLFNVKSKELQKYETSQPQLDLFGNAG